MKYITILILLSLILVMTCFGQERVTVINLDGSRGEFAEVVNGDGPKAKGFVVLDDSLDFELQVTLRNKIKELRIFATNKNKQDKKIVFDLYTIGMNDNDECKLLIKQGPYSITLKASTTMTNILGKEFSGKYPLYHFLAVFKDSMDKIIAIKGFYSDYSKIIMGLKVGDTFKYKRPLKEKGK